VLEEVDAIRFHKTMGSGKTRPCLLTCVRRNGEEIEVVAKLRAGCERKERSMVNEAIASIFAKDLGLPVPESFIVEIDPAFAKAMYMSDMNAGKLALDSIGPNFGTIKLPPGYHVLPKGFTLKPSLELVAGDILTFDSFIENSDRRPENPNMLYNEEELVIFDHDLAFSFDLVLGWKPPWEKDSSRRNTLRPHIFYDLVRERGLDTIRVVNAYKIITTSRLQEYGQALPNKWIDEGMEVTRILRYIEELVDNVDKAVSELNGALS